MTLAPARRIAVSVSAMIRSRSSQPFAAAASTIANSPLTWYAATGTVTESATAIRSGCRLLIHSIAREHFQSERASARTQALTIDGIAVEQEFLNGIVGQGVSVITVGISGSNSVDPLPEKITAAMDNLSRLATVADTLGEALGERQLIIDCLEEYGAPIGVAVRLIKRDVDRPGKIISEKNRLCGNLSHQRASVCALNLCGNNVLIRRLGLFVFHIRRGPSRPL